MQIRAAALLPLIAFFPPADLRAQQDSVSRSGFSVGVIHADSVAAEAPARTFSELLTGRLAGVEVLSTSGTVGAASRILIRGAGTLSSTPPPLVYVDGMRVDASASALTISVGGLQVSRLDDLDPQDISTIEVLRGPASTALYGTGASGGVILVTTKRGAPGPLRLHAYSSQGATYDPHHFPENVSIGAIGLVSNQPLENPTTTPYRTGYVRGYGLDASGGDGRATFYAAARWEGTGGVYGLPDAERTRLESTGGFHPEVANPSYLGRMSLRGTGQFHLSERADLTVSTAYLSSDLRLPNNDNSTSGLLANALLGSGDSSVNHGWKFFLPGTLFQVVNSQAVERFAGTVRIDGRPASFLALHALVGIERVTQEDKQLQRNGEGPSFVGPSLGLITDSHVQQRGTSISGSVVGSWTASGGVALTSMLGVEYVRDTNDLLQVTGSQLLPGSTSVGDAVLQTIDARSASHHTFGVSLEQRIAVRNRVFAGLAARWEHVGPDGVPAVIYPRADIAWVAPNVDPMLDSVRLRAAYGEAGSQPLQGFFGASPSPFLPFVGVTPERSHELEVGADAGVLRNRVTLGITYYHKSVRPLVLVITPPSGGFGSGFQHVGRLTNTGVELTLQAALLRAADLAWEATVTAWGNRNRLSDADPGVVPIIFGFGPQRFESGLPAGSYVTTPILGYQDLNGDGRISSNEVIVQSTPVFVGTPFPTQGASLGTAVTLRGRLRASGLLEYRGGNAQFNSTEWFRCLSGVCRAALDPKTPLAEQAKAAASSVTTSGFIYNADFVKLRELSLTYVAPDAWAQHLGAHGLTLTLAARNVATWTSYPGLDPEVSAYGAESFTAEDFFTQPPVRTAVARLDISF